MDVQRFEISIPEAADIRCPFTGQKIGIFVSVSEGVATYSAPFAMTLSEPQESVDRLFYRASMRNGVAGVAKDDDRLVDPYTGERMSLCTTQDGRFYLDGGFNPKQPSLSLADFVRTASRGKVNLSRAPEAKSVPPAEQAESDPEPQPHETVEDMTEKAGEDMAAAVGADRGKVTVSMSVKGKKPRK